MMTTNAPSLGLNAQIDKPCKILLVDDYEANLMIAGMYLDSFGLPHDIARSGFEALDKVGQYQYGAILMDIHMPDMDGLETTRRIREMEILSGRSHQPVIALTAHPYAGNSMDCQAAGMNWYIVKPFNPDELRNILLQYVEPGLLTSEA